MRVAVIGGGLFGCTAAILASRAGHEVHLYESKSRIMGGATSACYYRLHRGYHYPRSPETGRESLEAEKSFRDEYGECVLDGGTQLYAIAKHSRVNASKFRLFMRSMNLLFEEVDSPLVQGCEAVFRVNEPRLSAMVLNSLVTRKLAESGVVVHLKTGFPPNIREQFDKIIVATYASLNSVLYQLGLPASIYKFQVVEKPIVQLPETYRDTSIVVLDGDFCCLDPHEWSELHVLGHVSLTIHDENIGPYPRANEKLRGLIERGLTRDYIEGIRDVSRVRSVVESMAAFIPGVVDARYFGSMFAFRAVLAGVEETDARPTLVKRLDDQVVKIFSGKLGTAVSAGRQALAMIHESERAVA